MPDRGHEEAHRASGKLMADADEARRVTREWCQRAPQTADRSVIEVHWRTALWLEPEVYWWAGGGPVAVGLRTPDGTAFGSRGLPGRRGLSRGADGQGRGSSIIPSPPMFLDAEPVRAVAPPKRTGEPTKNSVRGPGIVPSPLWRVEGSE